MPVKAVTRATLVETITDPDLDQRVRKNAAKNLIHSYPAVTKTLRKTLELIPRPITEATFNAVADAYHESREKR